MKSVGGKHDPQLTLNAHWLKNGLQVSDELNRLNRRTNPIKLRRICPQETVEEFTLKLNLLLSCYLGMYQILSHLYLILRNWINWGIRTDSGSLRSYTGLALSHNSASVSASSGSTTGTPRSTSGTSRGTGHSTHVASLTV
ncbi:hypothetical protein LIER_35458 [Lithospermum erythrorhizon]|uniref:Uncharacterized protein n=1 Tax=Lithospermum erythrorhizon TaxID=34254 RepID=A0AAV3NS51_LITER